MRFVDRSSVPVPRELSTRPYDNRRQDYLIFLSLDPKERAQTRPPARTTSDYPSSSTGSGVIASLAKLFRGKCAFCESHDTLTTYRYRPIYEALPLSTDLDANLYYGWLADAWENLYPICEGCIPVTPNNFPVFDQRAAVPTREQYTAYASGGTGSWPHPINESPIYLDPCGDRFPENELEPDWDGEFHPSTERGRKTVLQFNLNRLDLVARRKIAFDQLWRQMELPGYAEPDLEDEFAGSLIALRDRVMEDRVLVAKSQFEEPETSDLNIDPLSLDLSRNHWSLESVEIRAYKSLEDIRIEMPKPIAGGLFPALLILGENAAGKSSILEAIALAMLSNKARSSLKEDPAKLLLDPRYLGDQSAKPRDSGEVRLSFAHIDGDRIERALSITPTGFETSGKLPDGFPVFGYGAYRHYRNRYRRWQPARPVLSLFQSDNLLSNPERWLLKLAEHQFQMVIRALRDIIGDDFRLIERDYEARQCLIVMDREGVQSHTLLDSVSSGFRTILALTCDVMRWVMEREPNFTTLDMARGLIMIDEVEAHLHPRWKVSIMDGLRRALPNMTFIATTHDPLCLRGMREGEVLVLQRIPGTAGGSDLPVMIETLTNLPDVTKLTINQLLTSDLFSLFDIDDPAIGQSMADLADALALRRSGVAVTEARMQDLLQKFNEEIEGALPVGTTEVSRLIQEAVTDYIIERRNLSERGRLDLRDQTKQRIRQLLGPV